MNIKDAHFIKRKTPCECPVFLKKVDIKKPVTSAFLELSCTGVYKAEINSERVGDYILAPGFTSYKKRLQYQKYDVTGLLADGENIIRVTLAGGWCTGRLSWFVDNPTFFSECALIALLTINYADSTSENIFTGDNSDWVTTEGQITESGIYDGETVDFTLCDRLTEPAEQASVPTEILIPNEGEKIKECEEFKAQSLITTPKGETVIDFGQNLTGYVRVALPADSGRVCIIDHAEALDRDGNFYTENLRSAKQRFKIVCGKDETVVSPSLTFMGFRYIRLDGFKEPVNKDCFTAVAVHSDMKRTAGFESSDALLNRLYENILWGQRSNFLDVPTDCPQRDERLGWTGDAQVFCRMAMINYDCRKFYTKWLHDLSADQLADGRVPHVIPDVLNQGGSAAWGDACCIVPWRMYIAYGDKEILKSQFDSMKKWIGYICSQCSEPGLWDGGTHFGDWLSLDFGDEAAEGFTDKNLIATAMLINSVGIVIKSGKVLGEDVSYYEKLLSDAKNAYRVHFIGTDDPKHNTQTAHVLALYFDIAIDRESEAQALKKDIEECGHLKTGFVGTAYLMHVLSDAGYDDICAMLIMKKTFPSWLYPVTMGATTMWERWDGIKPDGSFARADMNSFNHYAYGCVGDWLFEKLIGISPDEDEPGYRRIIFNPHPVKDLSFARGHIDTAFGRVTAGYEYDDNGVCHYSITVPEKASAVFVYKTQRKELSPGTHNITL